MGEQFTRELRLLTPIHFKFVFDDATPAVSPQLTILARSNSLDFPRLGITIAKKRVKLAHDRNRIKRLIRESFRKHQLELPKTDIIVIGKNGLDKLSNEEIFNLLNKLWKKLSHRCK
ncbi:ribonuclease P protein component [Alteromonadaceae bacterium M269]|nr:ribonuclease P protein component [Alteromonadaceae bacterium M269]